MILAPSVQLDVAKCKTFQKYGTMPYNSDYRPDVNDFFKILWLIADF